MKNTIWILTSEHNLYDQQGEYYISAWREKPSIAELKRVLKCNNTEASFLWNDGGGRKDIEDVWYYLREVSEGEEESMQ